MQLTTRAQASEARRHAVLAAALDCFDRLGYEAATIEDIRAASGASTGSLYHHFGDKQGIAAALYQAGLSDYRRGLLAALARASRAKASVQTVIRFHLDWAAAHPAWARYLLGMRREPPVAAIEAELRAGTRAFLAALRDHFKPFVAAGEIVDLPPELFTAQLFGPVQEFLRFKLFGTAQLDYGAAGARLAEAAWRALRA